MSPQAQKNEDLGRRLGIGLNLGAMGGGLAALASEKVVPRLLPKLEFSDVPLTAGQLRAMRDELSKGTRLPEPRDLEARLPHRRLSTAEKRKYLKNQGFYRHKANAAVAHRTPSGGSLRGHIAAHELGHARIHNKPVLGKALRFGKGAQPLAMLLSTSLAGVGGVLDDDDPRRRLADVAQYGGAVAAAPTLIDEAYASLKGYQALKKYVRNPEIRRAARRDLLRAYGTYAAAAAPVIAAPFAVKGIATRIRDHMQNQES